MVDCVFSREALTPEVWCEVSHLLKRHWDEIAHFKDIPLEPDDSFYAAAAAAGILRFYAARSWSNELVGYAAFFVKSNPHYKSSIQAVQDVIYLAPEMRGVRGWKFLKWCDKELEREGVDAIYHHVKAFKDFGPILERMGYTLVDQIYARRCDGSGRRVRNHHRSLDDSREPGAAEGERGEEEDAEGFRHTRPFARRS